METSKRVGQRFGRLLVVERAESDKNGRSRWRCQCDCGGQIVVSNGNLRTGSVSSCGCVRREHAQRLGREQAGEKNARWKGGYGSAYCRCVRSLGQSKKAARMRGYAACNATVEELVPTVVANCQLCGQSEEENGKRLGLDHDHKTGRFRGWLCDHCNRVVGFIEAHREVVEKYLSP